MGAEQTVTSAAADAWPRIGGPPWQRRRPSRRDRRTHVCGTRGVGGRGARTRRACPLSRLRRDERRAAAVAELLDWAGYQSASVAELPISFGELDDAADVLAVEHILIAVVDVLQRIRRGDH